jgi:hypothetical protein
VKAWKMEEKGSSDNVEEDDVGEVTVRANRRRGRRQGHQMMEDTGTVETEESDADSNDEDNVMVGGVLYQTGKRKRDADTAVRAEEEGTGMDLKVGDTVTVGTMTWERVEELEEDARMCFGLSYPYLKQITEDRTRKSRGS